MPFVDAIGPLAELDGNRRESVFNQALGDDPDDDGRAKTPPEAVPVHPPPDATGSNRSC